jgi:pimeloyl-ACP methyl ester carboxylesterase
MDHVLIHGTTQSPAGWDRLAESLEKRGHRTVAVDLPTDRPNLLAADYAEIVAAQVVNLAGPVVVGHSGAGLLLPAVARRLRASHLVWLAAVVPDLTGGRSFRDEIATSAAEMFFPEWSSLTVPPTEDPVTAAYFLFHDCDLATVRWGLSTVRLFRPDAVYEEKHQAGPLPPSTYVLPAADRTLRPAGMRRLARRRLGVEPIEVDGGHCAHVSRPDQVAEIIDSIH